ncbi:hypothetical protein IVG45_03265 [Methylomonas sp. LL1]|uniref:hypothetical protein n=1 Tax=Methylomonas sp. LL1 TaxID=2785785 RepID=UPI0018C44E55|nr:hypothetical protein [Methylomonas sp. LL1]QPK64011.1 hypothetical protein IVG45_03265 [Methylomonas sp. LL1]
MNKDYTRIPVNHEAAKKQRETLRKAAEKNSDLHENRTIKPTYGPRQIREGIRVAKALSWKNAKRGLVYIADGNTYDLTTTPSHNIELLIHHLPKEVSSGASNEDGSPIMLPFTLPTTYEGLSAKISHTISDDKKIHYGGDIVKPYLYQLALSELETLSQEQYRLTPFVFTTSKALERRFQGQQKDRVDFLRDRLQKALKEALQRPRDNPVSFWFALEMAGRGQPHIQGSMLIRVDEQDAVRQALYDLNGERKMDPDEKRDCLRLPLPKREKLFAKRGRLYTDLNWADYNLKERSRTSKDFNDKRPIVAVSQPLINHTKDYYKRLRKEFNRQCRLEKRASKLKKQRSELFGSW